MGPCWDTETPEGRGQATSPGNRPHGHAIRWVRLAVRDTEWAQPLGSLHRLWRDEDEDIQGWGGVRFPVTARLLRGEMAFDGWETDGWQQGKERM